MGYKGAIRKRRGVRASPGNLSASGTLAKQIGSNKNGGEAKSRPAAINCGSCVRADFVQFALEHIPERLVIDRVVELHFRAFYAGSQFARRPVGGGLLQVGIAALHIGAKNLCDPLRCLEIVDRRLDVVRQELAAATEAFGFRDLPVDTGLEDAVERQVGVGVRGHGANFSAHGAVIADGHADHGATIDGRGANLVGGLEMRIEPPVGVDAGIEDKAKVQRVGENAVEETPAKFGELLLAFLVPEEIGLALGDGDVGVHAAAVHADNRLGQEACRVAHVCGNLTAQQFVELNLVGGGHNFGVTEVDFELAWSNLGGILLLLDRKST